MPYCFHSADGQQSRLMVIYYLNTFVYMVKICLEIYEIMPVLYGTKCIWKETRTLTITKVVPKTKHALALGQRVLIVMMILQCICSIVPKNLLIICPYPPLPHTPPFPTAYCFNSAAVQQSRLRSKHHFLITVLVDQKIKIPARWSSFVIWFVLHIRVEA